MFEKFAEQFNNDVTIRYQQKIAALVKQAEGMTIEDLKGLTRTIGEAMVPQSMKDLGTILGVENSPTTNMLTRTTFMGPDGKPEMYDIGDDQGNYIDFNGDPDTFENSKYY